MSKAKTAEEKATAAKEVKEAKEAAAIKKANDLALKSVSKVDVLDPNGDYIRTYSKEVHGPKFKELAEEFVSKVSGRKIVKVVKKAEKKEAVEEGVKEENKGDEGEGEPLSGEVE